MPIDRYLQSLATDTTDLHFQSVDSLRCGNEQQFLVRAAKTDVGGPAFWDFDVLDLFARRIEHRNALISQVEVALIIERHAVAAHVAVQLLSGQRTVCRDVVAVGFLALDVSDVKQLAVG